jgi:hypothetical protein
MKGPVLDIAFAPDGAAWVASALELSRFDGQTWTSYGKLAHHVAVGPEGTLWVSGWEGTLGSNYVARYDGAEWVTYDVGDLLGYNVGAIAVTSDGDLWGAAGREGMVHYDGMTWTRFPAADGLPSEVSELIVAPDGVLWAVGCAGLARLDRDRWIPHEAGLCGGPVAFADDGTIWLGVGSSLYHLHP